MSTIAAQLTVELADRRYPIIIGNHLLADGRLLDEHQRNDHDESLPQSWLELLGSHWAPARYLVHAQQMSSNYLVALAPSVSAVVARGGHLILAGLLQPQAAKVIAAYRAIGLVLKKRITLEGWTSLLLARG